MECKNIVDVQKFVLECNDLLTGRFFDLNKRLEKFLTTLTQSEDIVDFLAECLLGFDEKNGIDEAFSIDRKTGNARVTLPTDEKKKLALFTTIFNDISSQKVNANQFLETYFQNNKFTPTQLFLEIVVKPYRDMICKHFEVSPQLTEEDIKKTAKEEILKAKPETVEEEKKVEDVKDETEELPHLTEILNEEIKSCNQVLALLKFEKKKTDMLDDVEFITNAIIQACEKKDLMAVNGLIIGLNYASKKIRNVRHLVQDMNNLIFDYYDYLANLQKDDDEEELNEEEEQEED